jgi:UPF0755 protein
MIKRVINAVGRTWFTGALYLLAGAGYTLYSVLWILRFMQTTQRRIAYIFVFCLLALAAGGVVFLFVPLNPSGAPIEFTVEKGTSLRTIGRTLAPEHVIPSQAVFILWMRIRGQENRIQAGRFTVCKGQGIISVSRSLLHATPVELSVTIPEGMTVEQTAGIVGRVFHVDSSEFVKECSDTVLLREHDIAAPTLEGYLFPDTYRFPPDVTSRDIIGRMVTHFEEIFATLPPPAPRQAGPSLSRHEYVILASIVEREAELASERQHISGVFHNRLERRIPLGADPTIRYSLRKFNGPLLVSELSGDSPYNTRKYAGLPPGPICSPGVASLAAALVPMRTKDLFFVAKWDGSGAHDFSMTNEEHVRKKEEIRRMNDMKKSRTACRLTKEKS